MRYYKLTILIMLLMMTCFVFGQVNPNDCYPKETTKQNDKSVFHKAQDVLPDSIVVTGEVVGVVPGICGSFCFGGSIKVKLKNKIEKYPYDHIYLAVGCSDLSNKCKMTITCTATKLLESDKKCTHSTLTNKFDDKDIPFYVITYDDLSKLEK